MRINAFLARATGIGRRQADKLIEQGRVTVDGKTAVFGTSVNDTNKINLDGKSLSLPKQTTLLLFNKPAGYVVSRRGQGAPTIFSLLPDDYLKLKPIGRLDKNSSGLLLLTNDGNLAQSIMHPTKKVNKVYHVRLSLPLAKKDAEKINRGVMLEDGLSRLKLSDPNNGGRSVTVIMSEGRKRQIRRTFSSVGNEVVGLHRLQIGPFKVDGIQEGLFRQATQEEITELEKHFKIQ